MGITDRELHQAYADHGPRYGGRKEDYFALLYLAKEFGQEVDDVALQVAFGGNDYGIDAFYLDRVRRNLYLFQFKWSQQHSLFKDSLQRLITAGMERVFGNPRQDNAQNQLLLQLKTALNENQAIVDRVLIHFVFNGDPAAAEQSAVLESLREDLESKKYLVDQYFVGRQVSLTVQFISNQTRKLGGVSHTWTTHQYDVGFGTPLVSSLPTGETLHVGFLPLMDLYRMYREMGERFFERNIRAGLSAERSPNKAIRQALAKIALREQDVPGVFVFNHNGVALGAEKMELANGRAVITEPRLLNGAQTVTSLVKFLDDNQGNPALKTRADALESIHVLAKIITSCSGDFLVGVTVCNNRQNPVEPWNLRASDPVQLAFQDKFRDDLGIYYERQENAFRSLADSDLEELGIEQYKAVQIKRLATTFLASQGELDKMSHLPDLFESDKSYKETFRDSYLRSNARRILLAYKIQFRLNRIIREIVEKGPRKYFYLQRARNLVWALLIQGVLNDPRLPALSESFGTQLRDEADYKEFLLDLASRRVRLIISAAVECERHQELIAEERYSFLRTKAIFLRCMEVAGYRYQWRKESL